MMATTRTRAVRINNGDRKNDDGPRVRTINDPSLLHLADGYVPDKVQVANTVRILEMP
jgi:hypothetical protein